MNCDHCWHEGVLGTGWIAAGETRCCKCEGELEDLQAYVDAELTKAAALARRAVREAIERDLRGFGA